MSSSSRTRPPGLPPSEDAREESFAPVVAWEPPLASPAALPEVPPPDDLGRLVSEVRLLSGDERQARLELLGERLEALGTEGASREQADLLLELLDGGQLEGLQVPGDRPARAVAVEALTRMGYPYALEVRPEDLAYLRGLDHTPFDWSLVLKGGAAGVLGVGFWLQWVIGTHWISHQENIGMDTPLVVTMGLALMALVTSLMAPRRSPAQGVGLGALLALSLLQVWLASRTGYHGRLSGGAGLLAWLLLMLARR